MSQLFIRPGARVIELTEGRIVPEMFTVGQSGIYATGVSETDGVWEVEFQGKRWTVEASAVIESDEE